MTQKFIPEFHDIGKLVDGGVKDNFQRQYGKSGESHVFVDFDFESIRMIQPSIFHKIPHDITSFSVSLISTIKNNRVFKGY